MIELLFNKDNKGNEEIKELLGFVDKSFTYSNFISDLYLSTHELIKLIGRAVYEEALTSYASDSPNKLFLFYLRYAIVSHAYMNYSKVNDLSHRSDGRAVRLDEYEKIPFEWMITRNDSALERKYYKALDALLEYLDNENEGWKSTDNYRKSHKTLIQSTSDFDDVFPLDSRFLFLKLEPGLVMAEDSEIQPRIGKELLSELKKKVTEENEELYKYIRHAMVYKSLEWAMRRLSVNLFPEGVLHSYLLNKNYHSKSNQTIESSEAAQQFGKDAYYYLMKIETLIKARKITYSTDGKIKYFFGFEDNDQFITT